MRLDEAIANYTAYRRAFGERFKTQTDWLKSFCRAVGGETELTDIIPEQINTFINGTGPITSTWYSRYSALAGFYRYTLSRGLAATSPLPTVKPRFSGSFVPYIYTHEELSRLLATALIYQKKYRCSLDPHTVKTMLLLLYGAGLRVSEALSLRLVDVDRGQAVLTIRDSKFFTSRLVPIGSQLNERLKQYAALQQRSGAAQNLDAPFFVRHDGQRIHIRTIEAAFRHVRKKAGISRTDGGRYQPRLHDLRHSFAVHRLTSWYRGGKDVQKLLPKLSVYLGHRCLADTSVYLTMTKELLTQASQRFEHYALKGDVQ